jgi:hypothetical protein
MPTSRTHAFLGIFLVLLCTLACRHGNSGTPQGKPMGYRIEYWSNHASAAHPTVLTVSLTESATLLVGSNADNPGLDPVGTFRVTSPLAETDALVQAARRLVHTAKPLVGPALPDEEIRKLTIVLDSGTEEMRHVTESFPPDPAFSAAESAAIALVKVMRQHPKVALSGQSLFRLDGIGHVQVAMKLVNVGTDALSISHPDFWADGSVLIQVTARRNDVPLAKLSNEHQRFLDLSKAQLVGTIPSLVQARTIPIAPHRDVTFKFTADLVLPKGNYDVWLALDTSLLDAQGLQIMRTELVSKKEQQRIF